MSGFLGTPDWSRILNMLLNIVPALICITLHELAHGYTAYRLGDNTAKNAGRLTLNPIKHIDPFGLLMMIVARFGWAKPVPVNMYNFKKPKRGMAITALAGPFMNVIIAIVSLFTYGLLYPLLYGTNAGSIFLSMFSTMAYLSCAFAVFNLLPIPPLDGSKILFSFFPDNVYSTILKYERYVMGLLMILVYTGLLARPLSVFAKGLYDGVFWAAEMGFKIGKKIVL